MNKNKIPINKPSITDLEIQYVNDAISYGWGEKCYDYIRKFEKNFSNYIDSKYALATSSCTGAIHLALLALGIKKGDEVIVPEITWIATVEPILYIGAKPIFVDIDKDSWCIDPQKIMMAITKKTKAIIPVHLYGNMCNMDEILEIASKFDLKVIEDAAEALGSEYNGNKAGSIGHVGVFSFHGTKTMTTGEGGILVTNDINIYEKAKILNDHGRNPRDPDNKMFWMRDYGYKYKISNLQAALGCAQIERIDQLVDKKIEIFNWYKKLLSGLPCSLNLEQTNVKNSFWLPTVVFEKKINFNRTEFFSLCKENGIDSRPFFFPLSSLPMFDEIKDNTTSYDIFYRAINLPSFHDLTYEQAKFITDLIKSFIKYK